MVESSHSRCEYAYLAARPLAPLTHVRCCVQEARRGHLTSNKTNEEALKHLRKNAVSKVASSASIVSTPLSRARHVDTSVGKDSAPPSSGYSPIASPILPARRAVMSEEDPYGDDEFESEVDVKPSLQLLRNKKSFSRQRKVDEVPVERVASLDKLVVLGADASPTAHLRGRASTRRVQARESSQDSSPGVASSLSSHSRQPSHDVESVILPSGVRVSHRTGFGYVPAPLPGGKPRACSPPDSTAHSPSHRRLLRTPLDGQLPDLGVSGDAYC